MIERYIASPLDLKFSFINIIDIRRLYAFSLNIVLFLSLSNTLTFASV